MIAPNSSSSPDPLSYTGISPRKDRLVETPLKQRSVNVISPSKSIVWDPQVDQNGKSPIRIRVTVATETVDDKRGRSTTRTFTVPIKDGEAKSPVKRRGRPRKTDMGVTYAQRERKTTRRSATPGRQRSNTLRKAQSPPSAIKLPLEVKEVIVPEQKPQHKSHQTQKISMTEMSRDIFPIARLPTTPNEASITPGEDFSMISVDSLTGRNSSFISHPFPIIAQHYSPHPLSQSYMPSSPPIPRQSNQTPEVDQTPQLPSAPVAINTESRFMQTPTRNSVRRSGLVLQDIVRSPDQTPMEPPHLFAPFSANTKRQLQESLQVGVNMTQTRSRLRELSSPIQDSVKIGPERCENINDESVIQHRALSRSIKPTNDPGHATDTSRTNVVHNTSSDEMSWMPSLPKEQAVCELMPTDKSLKPEMKSRQETTTSGLNSDTPTTIDVSSQDRSSKQKDEDLEGETSINSTLSNIDVQHSPVTSGNGNLWARVDDIFRVSSTDNQETGARDEFGPSGFANDTVSERKQADISPPKTTSVGDAAVEKDETGVFWLGRLANVQCVRPSERTEMSMLSELRPVSSPIKPDQHSLSALGSSPLSKGIEKPRDSLSPLNTRSMKKPNAVDIPESNIVEQSIQSNIADDNVERSALVDSGDEGSGQDSPEHRKESIWNAEEQLLSELSEYVDGDDSFDDEMSENVDLADNGEIVPPSHHQSVRISQSNISDGSRSYLELLNLASPVKIAVKFNDDSCANPGRDVSDVPSPIKSNKAYPPLFEDLPDDNHATEDTEPTSAPNPEMVATKRSNVLNRMTAFFNKQIEPAETVHKTKNYESADVVVETPVFSDYVLRLRRKYGLLSNSHPFTLAHIRTLHRLNTSIRQHPETTLVSLPCDVVSLLSSPTTCVFKNEQEVRIQSCVMDAFFHLLLPDQDIQRLETNGAWGDENAIKCKGWDSKGRHGSWFAFCGEGARERGARCMRGELKRGWVWSVLDGIVQKERKETI